MELRCFNGNLSYWPEFIENFKSCVHFIYSLNNNICMERLVSALDGNAKK